MLRRLMGGTAMSVEIMSPPQSPLESHSGLCQHALPISAQRCDAIKLVKLSSRSMLQPSARHARCAVESGIGLAANAVYSCSIFWAAQHDDSNHSSFIAFPAVGGRKCRWMLATANKSPTARTEDLSRLTPSRWRASLSQLKHSEFEELCSGGDFALLVTISPPRDAFENALRVWHQPRHVTEPFAQEKALNLELAPKMLWKPTARRHGTEGSCTGLWLSACIPLKTQRRESSFGGNQNRSNRHCAVEPVNDMIRHGSIEYWRAGLNSLAASLLTCCDLGTSSRLVLPRAQTTHALRVHINFSELALRVPPCSGTSGVRFKLPCPSFIVPRLATLSSAMCRHDLCAMSTGRLIFMSSPAQKERDWRIQRLGREAFVSSVLLPRHTCMVPARVAVAANRIFRNSECHREHADVQSPVPLATCQMGEGTKAKLELRRIFSRRTGGKGIHALESRFTANRGQRNREQGNPCPWRSVSCNLRSRSGRRRSEGYVHMCTATARRVAFASCICPCLPRSRPKALDSLQLPHRLGQMLRAVFQKTGVGGSRFTLQATRSMPYRQESTTQSAWGILLRKLTDGTATFVAMMSPLESHSGLCQFIKGWCCPLSVPTGMHCQFPPNVAMPSNWSSCHLGPCCNHRHVSRSRRKSSPNVTVMCQPLRHWDSCSAVADESRGPVEVDSGLAAYLAMKVLCFVSPGRQHKLPSEALCEVRPPKAVCSCSNFWAAQHDDSNHSSVSAFPAVGGRKCRWMLATHDKTPTARTEELSWLTPSRWRASLSQLKHSEFEEPCSGGDFALLVAISPPRDAFENAFRVWHQPRHSPEPFAQKETLNLELATTVPLKPTARRQGTECSCNGLWFSACIPYTTQRREASLAGNQNLPKSHCAVEPCKDLIRHGSIDYLRLAASLLTCCDLGASSRLALPRGQTTHGLKVQLKFSEPAEFCFAAAPGERTSSCHVLRSRSLVLQF
ncbi:unnamed protein product [Polarella glacialis]|uniref:Uncharacterized protein n=1 Tax=Polarella glacialis TaxID=89957 RepID=A0A813FE58_POLGL|nr:unnamed protein product [Polarella glacialis]